MLSRYRNNRVTARDPDDSEMHVTNKFFTLSNAETPDGITQRASRVFISVFGESYFTVFIIRIGFRFRGLSKTRALLQTFTHTYACISFRCFCVCVLHLPGEHWMSWRLLQVSSNSRRLYFRRNIIHLHVYVTQTSTSHRKSIISSKEPYLHTNSATIDVYVTWLSTYAPWYRKILLFDFFKKKSNV